MNPKQLVCKFVKATDYNNMGEPIYHNLPKIGGVELRIHEKDGKYAHYFCSLNHMQLWLKQQSKIITDDIVNGD